MVDCLLSWEGCHCQLERTEASPRLTDGKVAGGTAGFVEPLVGGAQDVLVQSVLPSAAELDRNIRVLRVVVPACRKSVSECLLCQRCVWSHLEMSILCIKRLGEFCVFLVIEEEKGARKEKASTCAVESKR